ncbi:hypothetical protein niasHS_000061 [Heterodera schachtii]|uniref:Uncharacterized protein n=1 Tax=Heterodera schachtii TaxID=97005 RepID=A0ABD2KN55_HETSC
MTKSKRRHADDLANTSASSSEQQQQQFASLSSRIGNLEKLLQQLIKANDPDKDNANPIDQLTFRLDKLEQLVATLVKQFPNCETANVQNMNGHNNGTTSAPRNIPWGCPPPFGPSQFTRMMNDAIIDSETIKEKSMRAVVERLPEHLNELDVVKQIADECGLLAEIDLKNVHRHPRTAREGSTRPRIVKIPFSSQKFRNLFLYKFRSTLSKMPVIPHNLIARRDMTHNESSILYDLRKKAYEANQAAGMFKYIVVDLELKALSNPKPLRTRDL